MGLILNVKFLVCFLELFAFAYSVASEIGCRDENGNLIDWYYLYKLPNKLEGHESQFGLKYLFITPTSTSQWTLSDRLINDADSIPGKTLSLIYNRNGTDDNVIVMMYNDEPPKGTTDGSRGHTKGTVVANDISGFWLIHSVPHFPPSIEETHYDYPSTGVTYGQSFLCISFTGDQMWKVGKQLQYNEPHFYSSHVPQYLKTIYPEFVAALEMKTITTAPFYNFEELQSRGDSTFMSFAKSKHFKKELYEDWVAPYFQTGDFYVETWRHGAGNIDSDCTKPTKLYNVEEISFSTKNITFKTMADHSKWMVSDEHNLICVGDINRQEHQKLRGGGTVCQQTKVSLQYGDLIKVTESCKSNRHLIRVINTLDVELIYD